MFGGDLVLKGGSLTVVNKTPDTVLNIESWTTGFVISMNILLEKWPFRAREYLKYMQNIRLLLLLSINASLFPEYCRIENYIHVVRSATLHLQLKIKTFQKCTFKNKEVEIMEGWCLSGYDGRCQWSLS